MSESLQQLAVKLSSEGTSGEGFPSPTLPAVGCDAPAMNLDEPPKGRNMQRRTSKEKMIETFKSMGKALSTDGAPPAFMD